MSLRAALIAVSARLPRARHRARVERDIRIRMRDGAQLLADLWTPGGDDGRTSAVLIRTPYARRDVDAVGELLAARGHPVLIQNCRGTFGSEGDFVPFFDERADGADTVDWASARWGADRPIVLLGASYFGLTARAALAERPERIAGVCLAVTATDFQRAVIFPDGVVAGETAAIWIDGLVHQEDPPATRRSHQRDVDARMESVLSAPVASLDRELLGSEYPPYQDWLAHPEAGDPWWRPIDFSVTLAAAPPTLTVAGWFDPFLVAQLDDHIAQREAGRPSRLVVGPWTHGSPGVLTTLLRESLRVLDGDAADGVLVHVGGERRWRSLPIWPPPTRPTTLHLSDDAVLAETPAEPGRLTVRPHPAAAPPAAGGRGLNPAYAGRRRQTDRERRDDVVCLTGITLTDSLTVVGRPRVTLRVRGDGVEHDWFVRLTDVDRLGRSHNVCDGFVRASAAADGSVADLVIDLAPTAHRFLAGHRVRLQVSGTGHPWHPMSSDPVRSREVITGGGGSTVVLPVLEADPPAPATL